MAGETIRTSNKSLLRRRASVNPAHPEPRINTRGFILFSKDGCLAKNMSLSLLLLLMEGVDVDDDDDDVLLMDMHRGATSERRFLYCLDDEEEDGEKNRVLITAPRVEEGTRRAIVRAMTTVTVIVGAKNSVFSLMRVCVG